MKEFDKKRISKLQFGLILIGMILRFSKKMLVELQLSIRYILIIHFKPPLYKLKNTDNRMAFFIALFFLLLIFSKDLKKLIN